MALFLSLTLSDYIGYFMHRFYIRDNEGRGLRWISGTEFWDYPQTFDDYIDFTLFDSEAKAREFAENKTQNFSGYIGKITLIVC